MLARSMSIASRFARFRFNSVNVCRTHLFSTASSGTLLNRPLNCQFEGQSRVMSTEMLSPDEVRRYSRQLIMQDIGVDGQLRLKNSSVLIVGCGGLGCPSSMYLAAAGVGRIGLVDHDTVELNNLHRQVLHTEDRVDKMNKAESIREQLSKLNSTVELIAIKQRFTGENAVQLISQYDVVIDATDNAPTRYLISDACSVAKRPLVSGAALRWDGQLFTYNYGPTGPCYRCLYPRAPPAGTVTNCSDGGVVGVVPGIIGSFQALETIKLLVGIEPSYASKMLLFDGLNGSFRSIRVRSRRPDCAACGSTPTVQPDKFDYEAFCGTTACDKTQQLRLLHDLERISVEQYKEIVDSQKSHLLLDVRPANDYRIVNLPNSINIPLAQLQQPQGVQKFVQLVNDLRKKQGDLIDPDSKPVPVFVLCKLGNASQRAVDFLKKNVPLDEQVDMKDISGGITAWSKQIDPSVPTY
jgi:adenylyltransferase/sulfurtransferase